MTVVEMIGDHSSKILSHSIQSRIPVQHQHDNFQVLVADIIVGILFRHHDLDEDGCVCD